MSLLVASLVLATGLLGWVVRELLVDHGAVVRAVESGRRHRGSPDGPEGPPPRG